MSESVGRTYKYRKREVGEKREGGGGSSCCNLKREGRGAKFGQQALIFICHLNIN